MRASVANGDTPLAALMRETAAATVDTVLAELRRRPIVHPEWLSLQDAAAYTGYSEQTVQQICEAPRRAEERPIQSQRSTLQAQRRRRLVRGGRAERLYRQGRAWRCARMR